ncbi:hypothetical protein [Parvularcula marina]|uniref:hypothetical protein n=1 Tax=Parvularcula marina TaxID=2292771 RepID=UPI00351793D3
MTGTRGIRNTSRSKWMGALMMGGALAALTSTAVAQESEAGADDSDDVVVVTGSRRVIQDSIDLKRNSTQIVDGLSADEIGDLPALSIGEALESQSVKRWRT